MKVVCGVKLYTVADVGQMLGLDLRTVRAYMRTGIIKARKIGTQWHVTEQSLKDYVKAVDVPISDGLICVEEVK